MISGPAKDISVHKFSRYIESFKKAMDKYENGYLNNLFLEDHIFDIFDNFLNDYDKEEEEHNLIKLEFSTLERIDYQYNPKALSSKLYGTPDMWQVILKANGYMHPGEMDLNRDLYVPTVEALTSFLDKMRDIKEKMGGGWRDLKDSDIFREK